MASIAPDLLRQICQALSEETHVGATARGRVFELPLTYLDGGQIALTVSAEGISDDGATLLRALGEGKLEAFERWEAAATFLRIHRMERRGTELIFNGRPREILRYIQGLRDLEVVLPRSAAVSRDFDDQLRKSFRKALEAAVRERRVPEAEAELLEDAVVTIEVPDAVEPFRLDVHGDFMKPDGGEILVILSHAGELPGQRQGHIKNKLGEIVLLRVHEHQSSRGRPRTHRVEARAILPKSGNYDEDDVHLVTAMTGKAPLFFGPKEGKQVLKYLRTDERDHFGSYARE